MATLLASATASKTKMPAVPAPLLASSSASVTGPSACARTFQPVAVCFVRMQERD
jgi:hypothetical protein